MKDCMCHWVQKFNTSCIEASTSRCNQPLNGPAGHQQRNRPICPLVRHFVARVPSCGPKNWEANSGVVNIGIGGTPDMQLSPASFHCKSAQNCVLLCVSFVFLSFHATEQKAVARMKAALPSTFLDTRQPIPFSTPYVQVPTHSKLGWVECQSSCKNVYGVSAPGSLPSSPQYSTKGSRPEYVLRKYVHIPSFTSFHPCLFINSIMTQ